MVAYIEMPRSPRKLLATIAVTALFVGAGAWFLSRDLPGYVKGIWLVIGVTAYLDYVLLFLRGKPRLLDRISKGWRD
jgi:hypothetical protein